MDQTSGKRRGRDRRRKKRNYSNNEKRTPTTCPVCEQPVRDVLTAINYQDQPAHFECVVKIIEDQEEMEPKDKVVYLGGGSFGIVQFRSGNQGKLFVRKRIQYEEKEKKIDWRRKESEHLRK